MISSTEKMCNEMAIVVIEYIYMKEGTLGIPQGTLLSENPRAN